MSDTNVRRPNSESPDPFGDWGGRAPDPFGSAPPATTPAPATAPPPWSVETPNVPRGFEPEPGVPLGFEPEPSSEDHLYASTPVRAGVGSAVGGFFGLLAVRIIIGIAILAFTTRGFGLFVDLGNDGPPNVPAHVMEMCIDARSTDIGASIGTVSAYRQVNGDQVVHFETVDGGGWDCLISGGQAFVDSGTP